MTMDVSAEKRAEYRKGYGPSYQRQDPDYTRCATEVFDRFKSSQCTRKCGHGPHGAYCKQHDPVAVKARRIAAEEEWMEKIRFEKAQASLSAACLKAIRAIAAGADDPVNLAKKILAAHGDGGAPTDQ